MFLYCPNWTGHPVRKKLSNFGRARTRIREFESHARSPVGFLNSAPPPAPHVHGRYNKTFDLLSYPLVDPSLFTRATPVVNAAVFGTTTRRKIRPACAHSTTEYAMKIAPAKQAIVPQVTGCSNVTRLLLLLSCFNRRRLSEGSGKEEIGLSSDHKLNTNY